MDYVQYLNSFDISVGVNNIVKKSRSDIKIIHDLDPSTDYKKIINILADGTYECHYFLSICSLLKLIGSDNDDIKYSWENAEKFMFSYFDEFNSDRLLYQKLIFIKNKISILENDEKEFINNIILSMLKYGVNFNENKQHKILKLKDEIIRYNEEIMNYIYTGGILKYNKKLEPLSSLMTTTEKNEKVIQLNKTLHGYLIKNTENQETRLYIDTIFSKYANKIIPTFVDLLLMRFNYANLLGYKNFIDFQINNCMYRNSNIIIDKIKEITINLRENYLKDDLYKKYITDIIYEHEQQRKKLNKKIGSFHILSSFLFIFDLLEKLFDISFKPVELITWNKNVETFAIYENNKKQIIGYLFLDLLQRKHKTTKTTSVCFSPSGIYPIEKNIKKLPIIVILSNLNDPDNISFDKIIEISHEFGHMVHYLFKQNKFCILNNIHNEIDFVAIPCYLIESKLWSKQSIESIIRFEKTFSNNDKPLSIVPDIIQLKQINFAFNLLQKCIISAFDQFIHSSNDFIKLILNNKQSISNDFNEVFKLIHKNAFNASINYISPSVLITLTNGTEGLTHCNIIAEIISTNLINNYDNDKNFWIFFKKKVLSNIHANSFELLTSYTEKYQILDINPKKIKSKNNKKQLNFIFEKIKDNIEDTFDINETNLHPIFEKVID